MGGGITLSASAVGVTAVTYQWLRNGTPIAGATTSTYSIASAAAGDAGTYSVTVANSYGSVTSIAVPLTVTGGPPVITLPPLSQSALAGTTASFSVFAVGGGPYAISGLRTAPRSREPPGAPFC